jgi:hypothetical protein
MFEKIKSFIAGHHWVIYVGIGLVALLVLYLLIGGKSAPASNAGNDDAAAEAAADQADEQANAIAAQQQEQGAALSATESEDEDNYNAQISVATLQAQTQQVQYNDEAALGTTQSNNSLSATENTNASSVQLGTVQANDSLSLGVTQSNDSLALGVTQADDTLQSMIAGYSAQVQGEQINSNTSLGEAADEENIANTAETDSAATAINASNNQAAETEQSNADSVSVVQSALAAQTQEANDQANVAVNQAYDNFQTTTTNDFYAAQENNANVVGSVMIANNK